MKYLITLLAALIIHSNIAQAGDFSRNLKCTMTYESEITAFDGTPYATVVTRIESPLLVKSVWHYIGSEGTGVSKVTSPYLSETSEFDVVSVSFRHGYGFARATINTSDGETYKLAWDLGSGKGTVWQTSQASSPDDSWTYRVECNNPTLVIDLTS